jgi:hypothetical protein
MRDAVQLRLVILKDIVLISKTTTKHLPRVAYGSNVAWLSERDRLALGSGAITPDPPNHAPYFPSETRIGLATGLHCSYDAVLLPITYSGRQALFTFRNAFLNSAYGCAPTSLPAFVDLRSKFNVVFERPIIWQRRPLFDTTTSGRPII